MFYDNITTAGDAVNEWYWTNKNALSPFLVEKIQPLLGPTKSPVETCVYVAEIIFANKETLSDSSLEVGIGLTGVCVQYNFFGLGEGRGLGIMNALKRELGVPAPEGTEWPEANQDPSAKEEFKEPA